MITRSSFDFSQPPRSRSVRRYMVLALALLATALISGTGPTIVVAGESGEQYQIPLQREVWRAVGPALSVRFRTSATSRSAVGAEAADLLPYFSQQADSAGLRYLVLKAYKPIVRVGDLGLYRGWNFRYERGEDGWTESSYW